MKRYALIGVISAALIWASEAKALDQSSVNSVVQNNVQWAESVLPLLLIYAKKGNLSAADAPSPAPSPNTIEELMKAEQELNWIKGSLDAVPIKIAPSASADLSPEALQRAIAAVKLAATAKSMIDLRKPPNATSAEADIWEDMARTAAQGAAACLISGLCL